MSFKELNLNSKLLHAIEASGFTAPTEIQRQAIPLILAGRDLMASAQTGTGKTAAFVLPSLERLLANPPAPGRGPRVLVLTPTRELAIQVNENVKQFGRNAHVTMGNVIGGAPFPPQIRLLKQPLDVLVATPGRLIDHMEQGYVDFSRLEILVLDEADRMLDMGFVNAVRLIAQATPARRQTLLFSATLEGEILAIAKQLLKDPARVQLAVNNERHALIEQRIYQADDKEHKQKLLSHCLSGHDLTQAVIFTATKRGADRLAKALVHQGHTAAALHGNMNQNQRKRAVERMRRGEFQLLVATDVAARGLDIKGISHVINFDLPMVAEDYIHRIGRTGRAGASGNAISLVGPEDWPKLRDIERLTGRKLERQTVPGLEPMLNEPRTGGARPDPRRQQGYRGDRRPQSQARNGRFEQRAAAPRVASGNRTESRNNGSNGTGSQRNPRSDDRRTPRVDRQNDQRPTPRFDRQDKRSTEARGQDKPQRRSAKQVPLFG